MSVVFSELYACDVQREATVRDLAGSSRAWVCTESVLHRNVHGNAAYIHV